VALDELSQARTMLEKDSAKVAEQIEESRRVAESKDSEIII